MLQSSAGMTIDDDASYVHTSYKPCPTTWPNCIAVVFQFTKLFSELKLLTDTLLFIHAEANREATESISHSVSEPSFFSQTPSYCYQTLP